MTEDIRDFLRPLGLERHCELLEDEAITEVSLLRSMGDEVLRESMQELGMEAADVDVLATALFGGGSDDDDCLVLEENEGGGAAAVAEDADSDDGLALEENLPSHTAAVALEPLPPAAPPGVSTLLLTSRNDGVRGRRWYNVWMSSIRVAWLTTA